MTTTKKRPSRLGRGLSSLMAKPVAIEPPPPEDTPPAEDTPPSEDASAQDDTPANTPQAAADTPETPDPSPEAQDPKPETQDPIPDAADNGDALRYVPIDAIVPNPHQPRQTFGESGLRALADSIRSAGLMQPIMLRRLPDAPADDGDETDVPRGTSLAEAGETDVADTQKPAADDGRGVRYQIVAGERRWRAAQLAGLSRIPALVRELDEAQVAELALIENLQREDLNPIEKAEAFDHLATQFNLSHDAIAQRVGLERSSISNFLRLLRLGDFCRRLVRQNILSMGQARAIAVLSDTAEQQAVAEMAVSRGFSVRQVELAVRSLQQPHVTPAGKAKQNKRQQRQVYVADIERRIGQRLRTRVRVKLGRNKGSGTLSIKFHDLDHFDFLMKRLGIEPDHAPYRG